MNFKATFDYGPAGVSNMDWQCADDYDPVGSEWVDATLISGEYQIQIDARKEGHTRHRHAPTFGPWKKGEPGETQSDEYSQADELEFLRFFYSRADFGPADDDVRGYIIDEFREETGKDIPEGY